MAMRLRRRSGLALGVAALVAGCAIKPEPLTETQLSQLAGENLENVVAQSGADHSTHRPL